MVVVVVFEMFYDRVKGEICAYNTDAMSQLGFVGYKLAMKMNCWTLLCWKQ